MRALLLALLLVVTAPALAQPVCYPGGFKGTSIGPVGWSRTPDGWWAAWFCATDTGIKGFGIVCTHGICDAGKFAWIAGVELGRVALGERAVLADDAWRANVTGPGCNNATDPALLRVCAEVAAWRAAQKIDVVAPPPPPPPPPVVAWKVAPNAAYTTRPTYAWANGVRASVAAAERVDVGAACDPAVGAGSYRGVLGRADRVAYCVEVKS